MAFDRRLLLKSLLGAGATGWFATSPLGPWAERILTAAEPDAAAAGVRLSDDVEPLARLLEDTPREQCIERVAERLRSGTSYQQLLAALYLAGIRNVNPQPPGFKFHCVFVIHAVHQATLAAPAGERLLPLLWAVDDFKKSQAQDVEQGDFRLPAAPANLPAPGQAWREFHTAMDDWNEERADRAIVSLVRSRGAGEIIEGLWRYGARDYRNIGHKAIFVANTWRTLATIGWRHAEPALRSLVLGLLDFGPQETVNDFAFADQTYVGNVARLPALLEQLPETWASPSADSGATRELLASFRTSEAAGACEAAAAALRSGRASAAAVWDAVHLQAGELMMRQPGIYGIHTVTSIHGLRTAYEWAADPATRLLLLLQAVGWLGQFQRFMGGRNGGLTAARIDDLPVAADATAAPAQVFEWIGRDAPRAARAAAPLAVDAAARTQFQQSAWQLIFRKASDAHDYKYAASIFEDLERVSPTWRPHLLATATYHLRGATHPDSPVVARAAAALNG